MTPRSVDTLPSTSSLILAVAREMTARDPSSPFSISDLVVECWKRFPSIFGMKQYAYPHAPAVTAKVYGADGLIARGLLGQIKLQGQIDEKSLFFPKSFCVTCGTFVTTRSTDEPQCEQCRPVLEPVLPEAPQLAAAIAEAIISDGAVAVVETTVVETIAVAETVAETIVDDDPDALVDARDELKIIDAMLAEMPATRILDRRVYQERRALVASRLNALTGAPTHPGPVVLHPRPVPAPLAPAPPAPAPAVPAVSIVEGPAVAVVAPVKARPAPKGTTPKGAAPKRPADHEQPVSLLSDPQLRILRGMAACKGGYQPYWLEGEALKEWTRIVKGLCKSGYAAPYPRGGYQITEAGRAAMVPKDPNGSGAPPPSGKPTGGTE